MAQFHYLVRGILIIDGKILVAKAKRANNTFLPGGHIETGEKAVDALGREFKEEFGEHITDAEFVGAIENIWPSINGDNHEINLMFKVQIAGLQTNRPIQSLEDHLEFIWLKTDELKQYHLKPEPTIKLIENMGETTSAFWGSTL
jgi:8-oxo-dGTP diphosphatase